MSVIVPSISSRYTIESELGHGGMATVYLAHERKHDRKVAIKVMRPELAASLGGQRFLREIGIVARLSHPHIVPLIDSGDAEGALYYVSPYIAGGSLRDRLQRDGRLPVAEALRIAEEIGAALDYAHRNGFVHRDVKPENILFADGHAVLGDFGVAQVCCAPGTEQITEIGLAVGTPAYMSPEQVSGEQNLPVASDIYSLACVVYEMLTGQPPFTGPNAAATMAKHITTPPRPLRALRGEIPQGVERAIAKGLAKDPAERFASAHEFVAALHARDVGTLPHSIAGTRAIAVLPFVNASPDPGNEYLSDGLTDELINALAKIEGLRVASRTSVFALKGKPQDVRAIGALLGVSHVLDGTVRRSGDRLRITAQLSSADDGRLLWSERYDRQLDDVFAIEDEISRTIVSTLRATSFADLAEPVPRRYTDNVKAYSLYLRGRFEWNKRTTDQAVTEAIRLFELAIAEDPGYALAYTGLSDCYSLQIDYRSIPVADGLERAKYYARKAIELDDSLPEAHASLAWCLFVYDWDWDAADHEFRRAIEVDPRYAPAHQWWAFLLVSRGNIEEALIEGHTALELDPTSVSVRRSMGWLYYYARRYDQARYHLTRAIAMNPMAEESYRVLGFALAAQGELAEAERVLRDAVELPGAPTYAKAALGYVLARAGRRDDALAVVRELEEMAKTGYVSPVAFGYIFLGLDDLDRTFYWMEKARAERRGWMVYLKVTEIFDRVRGDPRFGALVEQMNL